jgi:hypothetical protein
MESARRPWAESPLHVTTAGTNRSEGGPLLEPKPSHRIPIWLGTYGRKALELTGRCGPTAWIPSMGPRRPRRRSKPKMEL